MTIDKFEDIIAWQKAKSLTVAVYQATKIINDKSFSDQLQRASVSVMNNIAEGFERKSDNEFRHFLFIAKGSAGEVRSMIILAIELGYITTEDGKLLIGESIQISKLLSGLIKSL